MITNAPWSVGVVIPARDEADLMALCLRSVLAAIDAVVVDAAVVDAWVVVVADTCADDTAAIARVHLGDRGEVGLSAAGRVGEARGVGTARVEQRFARCGTPMDRVWLMATDADSVVPVDWIAAHLAAADAGAAAVAGTVTVASFAEHPSYVSKRYRDQYTVHADGSHPHRHGTNLGVRADAFFAVGGWLPLGTGEDHDLWSRLRAADYPVVSTIQAPVATSGRRLGRAPEGFAALLNRLELDDAIQPS